MEALRQCVSWIVTEVIPCRIDFRFRIQRQPGDSESGDVTVDLKNGHVEVGVVPGATMARGSEALLSQFGQDFDLDVESAPPSEIVKKSTLLSLVARFRRVMSNILSHDTEIVSMALKSEVIRGKRCDTLLKEVFGDPDWFEMLKMVPGDIRVEWVQALQLPQDLFGAVTTAAR